MYFSQDLNETQMLVQCNERYSVINKNIIVSESDYNEYQDSIYKDILKKFQDFISCNRINESMVLRIIEDLKLKISEFPNAKSFRVVNNTLEVYN